MSAASKLTPRRAHGGIVLLVHLFLVLGFAAPARGQAEIVHDFVSFVSGQTPSAPVLQASDGFCTG